MNMIPTDYGRCHSVPTTVLNSERGRVEDISGGGRVEDISGGQSILSNVCAASIIKKKPFTLIGVFIPIIHQ